MEDDPLDRARDAVGSLSDRNSDATRALIEYADALEKRVAELEAWAAAKREKSRRKPSSTRSTYALQEPASWRAYPITRPSDLSAGHRGDVYS